MMTSQVERCITDISYWCACKRLQLNADKTEVLWCGSTSHLRQLYKLLPDTRTITINQSTIKPAIVVRDLGVWFDVELSMRQYVSRVSQTCFYHLRRLRSVRQQFGRDVTARLVSALVLALLDYCNAALVGLPASTLAPLQRVINTATRLMAGPGPRDHVTHALYQLHWLPIAQRIEYKICLLVHKSFVGHVPDHIIDLLTPAASDPSQPSLRLSSSSNLIERQARRCISHLESSSYRAEDHAIDYCIQETSENFFLFSSDNGASRASRMTA